MPSLSLGTEVQWVRTSYIRRTAGAWTGQCCVQPSPDLKRYLYNQYYLVFLAVPRRRAGLQRINVQTEVANSEIAAPDNVWVPAAGD